MRTAMVVALVLVLAAYANGDGTSVHYRVGEREFVGYFISPLADAPLVLLVHDWDGLTEYEVERAGMLAELGYTASQPTSSERGYGPKRLRTGSA